MARKTAAISIVCLLVLSVVAAEPGRKLLQLSRTTAAGSGTTVALSGTSASIQAAADGQSTSVTTQVPKPQAQPAKTDKGTAAVGAPTYIQAGAAAQINKYASGGKPTPKAPPKGSDATAAIANAPKKDNAGGVDNTGRATNFQAATSAAIGDVVARAGADANRNGK